MAEEDIIARRYARGLAEHAVGEREIAAVRHDLKVVSGLVDPRSGSTYVPEFANFLNSPLQDAGEKKKIVSAMFEKAGIGKTVSDFTGLLIDRGRAGLLPRIAHAFGEAAEALTGEHTAVVQTARPLTADQLDRLQAVLVSAYGGVIHIHQQIEPSLLAGAKVVVGDQTFDGSVLGKLDAIRRRLTNENTFAMEIEAPGV